MYMQLGSTAKKAESRHINSYQAFKEWINNASEESELERFQKYHGIIDLFNSGINQVYVNAQVRFLPDELGAVLDICGLDDQKFTAVICEAGIDQESFLELFELLNRSSNIEEIWVYPLNEHSRRIYKRAVKPQSRNRVKIGRGTIDHLDEFLKDTLETIDLFESRARRMMLFSMLESPREKRYLREFINPKLLYENLDLLRRMNLIEEVSEQVYGLSKQGEILMQEYLHFLDRIRRSINNFEEEQ